MKVAICDDEKEIRDILKGKIESFCPEADVVLYETGTQLLESGDQADLLFLDIQMPGLNGMDAARELRKTNRDLILIFVTAWEEHVFEAFDVEAFYYLVKPFSDEKFYTVLQKAAARYREHFRLLHTTQAQEKAEKSILIKTGGVSTNIYVKDIIYAEVFNRKIVLHTTRGEIEYYGKLSALEKKLGEDFFRSHRAYLVHFRYVVKYNASMIALKQGSVLMAKPRYADFVKKYHKYIQRTREA